MAPAPSTGNSLSAFMAAFITNSTVWSKQMSRSSAYLLALGSLAVISLSGTLLYRSFRSFRKDLHEFGASVEPGEDEKPQWRKRCCCTAATMDCNDDGCACVTEKMQSLTCTPPDNSNCALTDNISCHDSSRNSLWPSKDPLSNAVRRHDPETVSNGSSDALIDVESFSECSPQRRHPDVGPLLPKSKSPNSTQTNHENETDRARACKESVPGTQSVFVATYGCSHNTSDAEYMMGQLDAYGYKVIQDMESADACLINSCTVKNPSQDVFMTAVKKAKALGKPTIVSGCVPQADRHLNGLEDVSVVGTTQIDRIVEVVEQSLKGNVVKLLAKKSLPTLDLPKIRKNTLVEIIPLSTGCLGACTYCKTKQARGKLGSYEPEAILQRAAHAIREGVQQIWLTSEDTGAYGLDIGTNIVALLTRLLELLPDTVMLRIGMTNPPYMMDHIRAIGEILRHPQVFKFLHIPVQSGSDRTLKRMVREYTVSDFRKLVNQLREHVPDLTIATDIICGFPEETDADHKETVALIEEFKPPVVNISQFYPRPRTPAASMKRVQTKIAKARSREITQVFDSYRSYEFLLSSTHRVWFTEHSNRSEHTVGHTAHYVKVLVNRNESLIGKSFPVYIDGAFKWHVTGVVCGIN